MKNSIVLGAMVFMWVSTLSVKSADTTHQSPSYGSSWYLAGGYGQPQAIRAETGYVFGNVASVGLMVNGPASVEGSIDMEVGVLGRLFVPIASSAIVPFVAVSYSGTFAPFSTARSTVAGTIGSLFELHRGIHFRAELGAAGIRTKKGGISLWGPPKVWSDPEASLSWSLQVEFALATLF